MAAMQDFEEHFKELSADVIANSFGTHQDNYLKYKNYQNKRKSIDKFKLGPILDSLRMPVTDTKRSYSSLLFYLWHCSTLDSFQKRLF